MAAVSVTDTCRNLITADPSQPGTATSYTPPTHKYAVVATTSRFLEAGAQLDSAVGSELST